jgi:tetrathionate reductase subunit B
MTYVAMGCKEDEPAPTPCDEIPTTYPELDSSEVRWGFLIDLSRCKGCKACSVSCKTEFSVPLGVFRGSVIIGEKGEYPTVQRLNLPWRCNHCSEPVCLERCPTTPVMASLEFPNGDKKEFWARATYQRPDGLIHVDKERCVGCGRCVADCPYDARFLNKSETAGGNPADYDLSVDNPAPADKCSFCIHRMVEGVVPACVNACPADARLAGNLNDPNSEISQAIADAGDRVSVLLGSSGTEPALYYIDLDSDVYDTGYDIRDDAGQQLDIPNV